MIRNHFACCVRRQLEGVNNVKAEMIEAQRCNKSRATEDWAANRGGA